MRSAEAAKSTAQLIAEGVNSADEGVALNDVVMKNFDEIAEHVNQAASVMAQSAEASKEQSASVAQINKAVGTMSESTQQSAATTEESASAAEELSGQARSLLDMVARFQLGASGMAAPAMTFDAPNTDLDSGMYRSIEPPAGGIGANGGGAGELIPFDDKEMAAFESF